MPAAAQLTPATYGQFLQLADELAALRLRVDEAEDRLGAIEAAQTANQPMARAALDGTAGPRSKGRPGRGKVGPAKED